MIFGQLRAFHAVAAEGGFSKAAKALNVSQPAVSAQVKALEDTYRLTLIERRPRGIQLTEPGQRLFEIVGRIFRLEEEADQMLRTLWEGHQRQFPVGRDAPYSASQLLAQYGQMHPGVHVSLIMGVGRDIERDLRDCRIDVAIMVWVTPDPAFFVMPYATHRIVVVVGRDHPWADRQGIRLSELADQRMVPRDSTHSMTSLAFERTVAQAGISLQRVMLVVSRENLREAVAAGVGIGVAIETGAVSDLRGRGLPVTDADMTITDNIVCMAQRKSLASIRSFVQLAQQRRESGIVRPAPVR